MNIPNEIEAVCLLGWRVYPCSRTTRRGCFKGATDAASYDLNVVAGWCQEFRNPNWRVVMQGSGIWGLDVDVPGADHASDGVIAMKNLVSVHGPLPDRPMTRSGGGGYAIFFKHNGERIVGKTNHPYPGIDPRRGRLSVTIPPSVHITTRQPYRWLHAPWNVTPPVAPAWLLKLVEEPPEPATRPAPPDTTDVARNRLYRAATAVAQAGQGARNETLNRRSYQVGRMLAEGLLAEQEAVEALYSAARTAGLDHHEARGTIKSGISSGLRRGASG